MLPRVTLEPTIAPGDSSLGICMTTGMGGWSFPPEWFESRSSEELPFQVCQTVTTTTVKPAGALETALVLTETLISTLSAAATSSATLAGPDKTANKLQQHNDRADFAYREA